MEYRLLGRSGLKVSALSMGTATFGGNEVFGRVEMDEAGRQIDLCLDHGVNLYDTSNAYGAGVSEQMLGEILAKDNRRQNVVLATKVRFPAGKGPNDSGLSRKHIIEQCEISLKRLKTDVIDIYQVHHWDGQTPVEETIDALDRLVTDGKVRYIGCSNYSGWQVMKAVSISDRFGKQRFVSQQIHYTLFSREAEYELMQVSLDQGLGMLIWSPLAGGLLTGKYRRDVSPEGTRHTLGFSEPPIYERDRERLFQIVDVIVDVADRHNVTGAQVALAWLLQRPGISSVIMGGRTLAHIEDNLKAADLALSAEDIARLDAVSQLELIYPHWHQAMNAMERLSEVDLSLLAPFVKKKS